MTSGVSEQVSERDAAIRIRVRVPASAANLGPGYDSFGLALAKYDDLFAERIDRGLEIAVDGVGAGTVPTDETHLVYRSALRAFEAMDEPVPGMRVHCTNAIPHAGGQGSSAAAIVSGILVARGLTPRGRQRLPDDDVFCLATDMEGHPDNVAPVMAGGFTIAWMGEADRSRPRMTRFSPCPDLRVVLLTAESSCETSQARAALPNVIPHADAAANTARAALMARAITTDPTLLLDATEDWLHQRYRAEVMPRSAALLRQLRAAGHAAVLSGAGPSMLLLSTAFPDLADIDTSGFRIEEVRVPREGATVNGVPLALTGAAHRSATNVAPSPSGPVA